MKQESARALKLELLAEVTMRPKIAVYAAHFLAPSREGVPPPTQRVFGLGMSGRKGNYRIALRIYNTTPGIGRIIAHIRDKCKGEIDERIVGQVFKQAPWHQKKTDPS